MLLITRNGWFYCFCYKYQSCELNYNRSWEPCLICRIPTYLSGYEKELDQNQFNLFKLKQLVLNYFCSYWNVIASANSLCCSSSDHYTGQKSETPLREQIKFTTKFLKKGEKKYFDFVLLIFYLFFSFIFFKI